MPPWPAWHYLRLYSPGPARGLTGAVQMHAALNFSPARIWKGVVISCLVSFFLGGDAFIILPRVLISVPLMPCLEARDRNLPKKV